MSKTIKKVILFIVEGPTDETTLKPILKKIIANKDIRFHLVRGDITLKKGISRKNAFSKVNDFIKNELNKSHLKKSDIFCIFHLIDTDGAFIPSNRVVEKVGLKHIKYFDNKIESSCPTNIIRRNSQKLEVVKRLYNCHIINRMNYYMLYFSRNLEHSLENDDSELTEDQKVNYADNFADKYEKDISGFMDLINSDSLAEKGLMLKLGIIFSRMTIH